MERAWSWRIWSRQRERRVGWSCIDCEIVIRALLLSAGIVVTKEVDTVVIREVVVMVASTEEVHLSKGAIKREGTNQRKLITNQ